MRTSLYLYWLFTLAGVQYSAAGRTFKHLTQRRIDLDYLISHDADNSNISYEVRIGTKNGNTLQKVMMKIDKIDGKMIQTEFGVFRQIYKNCGEDNLLPFHIPNMFDYGFYEDKRAIILNLLGKNVMNSIADNKHHGPHYGAVCHWAKQMIIALRFIHQLGYVHRDVRPENIVEGVETYDPNRNDVPFKGSAYLCNFGLASTYIFANKTYKRQERRTKLDVTPYFSSRAVNNLTQYPRDDMESLGYTMLRIAGSNELPWANSSTYEAIRAKDKFLSGSLAVGVVSKRMGISDMGIINVFKNFFELLRIKYIEFEFYDREIDYEELSDCFVYPARPVLYLGQLEQRVIDTIYHVSKNSTALISGEQYRTVRIEMNQVPNLRKNVMLKTAVTYDAFVKKNIKVFKDLHSKSEQNNLLPVHIVNMLGYGMYDKKRAIVLDLLGDDFTKLTRNNADTSPQYYAVVCHWAKQMITALEFIHKHGYVHRDIKPDNIAEGVGDGNDISLQGFAYLFNFGHAVTYKYENGTFKERKQYQYTETASDRMSPFVSRAAMDWYTHYPRDDMEELGYTMLTIAGGVLPWYNYWLDDMLDAKTAFCQSDETVENVCRAMGMSDVGIMNVFKNFFRLLQHKYFTGGAPPKEIDYEELRTCFVYPANKGFIQR